MTDMTGTIIPKSDQLNFDDLVAGPRTITVTKVSLLAGDQPVAIHYEGDEGKPYKPSKGMRRVLVSLWGADGAAYVGRSMTLYGEPSVTWGGVAVGGIRISHMSHIDREVTLPLTISKSQRKPITVRPLVDAPKAGKKLDPGEAFKALLERLAKSEPNPGDAKALFSRILGQNGYESIGQLLAEPKDKQKEVYREIEGAGW